MDAIVEGAIEVDVDLGCLWLSTPDGSRHPVVWPFGTESRADPFVVVLPDGSTASPGDVVSGGGGYVDATAATTGMEPFPDLCVQDGQAAVFNADSELVVLEGAGSEDAPTLVGRFSIPESIGLELIAVNPNRRSVAVADLVSGTVHLYQPDDYVGPEDAIDGASGGGGFIHLWSQGTVYSYPGRLTDDPLVYRPTATLEAEGVAPILEVVPAVGGEQVWLVQDGSGFGPTLVELVNLVEVQVSRVHDLQVSGSWQPVGATSAGLVLVSNEGAPRTMLVSLDGSVGRQIRGEAISVGWKGAAVLVDGSLAVFGADLGESVAVEKPSPGAWTSVAGPLIPSDAPPVRTGGEVQVVGLIGEDSENTTELVVVRPDGSTRVIYEMASDGIVIFSRAEDWIAAIETDGVTIIPGRGAPLELGAILPEEHWVLTGG